MVLTIHRDYTLRVSDTHKARKERDGSLGKGDGNGDGIGCVGFCGKGLDFGAVVYTTCKAMNKKKTTCRIVVMFQPTCFK